MGEGLSHRTAHLSLASMRTLRSGAFEGSTALLGEVLTTRADAARRKTLPALRQQRGMRQPTPPRQHRRSLVPRHRPQRLAPARPHSGSTPEPRQRVPTTPRSTSAGLTSALERRPPQRAQPVSTKITRKSPSSRPSPSPLLQDVRGGRLQRPITAPGKRSQHEGSSRQELPRRLLGG